MLEKIVLCMELAVEVLDFCGCTAFDFRGLICFYTIEIDFVYKDISISATATFAKMVADPQDTKLQNTLLKFFR